jgi:hypothetical protein
MKCAVNSSSRKGKSARKHDVFNALMSQYKRLTKNVVVFEAIKLAQLMGPK